MRRRTLFIVVHSSATRASSDIGIDEIRTWHVDQNGWRDVGYAAVIRRDGEIEFGRHFDDVGAHVRGYNSRSVGICMVGGLDEDGNAEDNYTDAQYMSLYFLIATLKLAYPGAEVLGHRDLSPDLDGDGVIEEHEWLKECPCFDVRSWWRQQNGS